MSLRDIAKKADCSISILSDIERNRSSPSLRTLEKICQALDVTVSDFLRPYSPPSDKPFVIPAQRDSCEVAMSWKGARMLRVLGRDQIDFTALIFCLEPGGGTARRHSAYSHRQLCFVLKGEVTLRSGDASYSLTTRDGIFFNTLASHEWINEGEAAAEVLVMNPFRFILFEQVEENLRWQRHVKRERQIIPDFR